jgi:hypothetical protein
MIRKLGAVSLVALGLFAGSAWAQEGEPAPGEGAAPVEQAPATDQPADAAPVAEEAAAAVIPAEVQALLDDTRPVTEIETNELRERARAARNFVKQQGLPDDVRGRLQQQHLRLPSSPRLKPRQPSLPKTQARLPCSFRPMWPRS